ncbi:MAG TPA: hypothetical protein EYG25_02705 [Candidatus Poseidoniales archaeon]|uniref:Uncharacterized protein n=1 Tax=Marine Group III euryarchaeote TaxID=2173149 RepID=A0A7C7ZE14_9ARCH|nr:hypothetical protein [Marine Group III euryarchaeote]HIL33180.1 hypothetical protein [Candidatus Poseidoniales archaeon]
MDLSMELLGYTWNFEFFVAAFLFGLGLATLGSGLFTAYFGAGKSQQIGFGLIVMAILVLGLQYHQTYIADPATFDAASFRYGLIAAIAAMVGMGAGMFVVLFILMKVDTVDDLEDLDLEDLEDLDLDEELKKLEEELAAEDGGDDSDNGGDDAPAEDTDKEDKA